MKRISIVRLCYRLRIIIVVLDANFLTGVFAALELCKIELDSCCVCDRYNAVAVYVAECVLALVKRIAHFCEHKLDSCCVCD